MSDERVPSQRDLRISDAERERYIGRLGQALSEGRLSLTEYEDRVGGVLQARTRGDLEPYFADLPGQVAPTVADSIELRGGAASLRRTGRWAVPRRLVVAWKAGSVYLDLRTATINHQTVEIDLNVVAGSTTIVLPPGGTANVDGVAAMAGNVRSRVPAVPVEYAGAPHVVVTGRQQAGGLVVRYERKFLWWRW